MSKHRYVCMVCMHACMYGCMYARMYGRCAPTCYAPIGQAAPLVYTYKLRLYTHTYTHAQVVCTLMHELMCIPTQKKKASLEKLSSMGFLDPDTFRNLDRKFVVRNSPAYNKCINTHTRAYMDTHGHTHQLLSSISSPTGSALR
jgi:hypothetical protein